MSISSNFGPETSTPVPTPKRVPLALSTGKISTGWVQAMVGSNGSIAGDTGLVPIPLAADNVKFLRGDGTWQTLAPGGVTSVNTRTGAVTLIGTDIPAFIASGGSHAAGAVPDPGSSAGTTKFLREDATWVVPPAGETNTASNQGGSGVGVFKTKVGVDLQFKNINASMSSALSVTNNISNNSIDLEVATMQGATGTVAGAKGLVPDQASTDNVKFLRGDGTWQALGGSNPYSITFETATPSGSALVGGDHSGLTRGTDAFDIQKVHTTTSEIASGARAIAIGSDNTASGPSAIAIGDTNTAAGGQGIAIGKTSSAAGNDGMAVGVSASASAAYGTAIGAHSAASALYCIALGRYAAAGQPKAIAIGDNATATSYPAPSSIAIGDSATAANYRAIAIGMSSSAAGGDSISIGYMATSTVANDIAIGGGSTANGTGYGPCVVIGRTSSATNKGIAIGDTVTSTGHKSVAIGDNCQVTQHQSVCVGVQVKSLGTYGASQYTVNVGSYSSSNAKFSILLGRGVTTGRYATHGVAIGNALYAGGVGSIVMNGFYASNYRPNTINVGAFHLLAAPFHNNGDTIAYGWNYSAAQSSVSTGPMTLTTVNTRRTIGFPQYCAMFLDRVSVIATEANTVTVQPQVRITGGVRGTPFSILTGSVSAGTTVSVPVIDSTGFSTGDWVVFDKDGQRTRTAIAVAAGKLSNVPDGTHIEIDKLTVNVASGVYVTKLTATTDNVLAATATSGLTAAGKRSNLASPDGNGYEVFVMDLSTAATATTLVGRVILSGSLMDINPTGRFDYT